MRDRVMMLIFLTFLCTTRPTLIFAYELSTHARLTQTAVSRSILNNSKFVKELGIDASRLNPFGDIYYYDMSVSPARERRVSAFEARFMGLPDTQLLTLPAWLLRGAIREDDWTGVNIPLICSVQADNPQDDNVDRPLNHFYDPIRNIPLTVLNTAQGQTAPDWGTGAVNAFTQPNTPQPNRQNHYTIFDAREAMYRASPAATKQVTSSPQPKNYAIATGPLPSFVGG